MVIFKLALRNLTRHSRRNLVLLAIMAGSVFILFVGNAVFDGTTVGISESYTRSFTGDLVVRPREEQAYGLFGNETPLIGELTKLSDLVPYPELEALIGEMPEVGSHAPQLSGLAYLELPGYRAPAPIFGIRGEDYFAALPGLSVSRGRRLTKGERGILMSEARAAEIARLTNQKLDLGQTVQFTIATDSSFRIRALPIVGFTSYPIKNETLDRIVLIDAATFRSLYGFGSVDTGSAQATNANSALLGDGLEELFAEAAPDSGSSGQALDRRAIETDLSRPEAPSLTDSVSGPWNFLVLRLVSGAEGERTRVKLNGEFKSRGWPLEAVSWRDAAGSSALLIYWLRIIFNSGVAIVAFAGLIVVINSLVTGVLERSAEIGSMRALGAQKSFVSWIFALETGSLALCAGFLGSLLGVIAVAFVSRKGIAISNPLLIQLFGGNELRPAWSIGAIARAISSSLLMGALAWIYPVVIALRVEPVVAMRSGE